VVDELAGELFKHGAIGMDEHRLVVLHRLVATSLGEAGSILEKGSRNSFTDCYLIIPVGDHVNFGSFSQADQLLPNVECDTIITCSAVFLVLLLNAIWQSRPPSPPPTCCRS